MTIAGGPIGSSPIAGPVSTGPISYNVSVNATPSSAVLFTKAITSTISASGSTSGTIAAGRAYLKTIFAGEPGTVTRAGHANLFDYKGKLTTARHNIVAQSANLAASPWQPMFGSGTITPSTDGTNNIEGAAAYKFAFGSTNAYYLYYYGTIFSRDFTNQPYVYSIDAKAGTHTNVGIGWGGNSWGNNNFWVTFNLTGTSNIAPVQSFTGVDGGTIINAYGTYLGSGWFRLNVIGHLGSVTSGLPMFQPLPTANGNDFAAQNYGRVYWTPAGTETLYFSRAHAEKLTYQTSARDYIATTGTNAYARRVEYDPNTKYVKGVLVEQTKNNNCYSFYDTTPGPWLTYGGNVIIDSMLSPDGVSNAYKLDGRGTVNTAAVYMDYNINLAGNVTGSVFAKAGTERYFTLNLSNDVSDYATAVFDLLNLADGAPTETVTGNTTGVISIRDSGARYIGDGWFRLWLSVDYNMTIYNIALGIAPSATSNMWDAYGNAKWNLYPDNTKYVYVAMPQVEVGNMTSYIYTTNTAHKSRPAETYATSETVNTSIAYIVEANNYKTSNTFSNGTSITLPDSWVLEGGGRTSTLLSRQIGKLIKPTYHIGSSVTRSTNATYFAANGVLAIAGPDEVRVEYYPPTSTKLGVAIEGAGNNVCQDILGSLDANSSSYWDWWGATYPANSTYLSPDNVLPSARVTGRGTQNWASVYYGSSTGSFYQLDATGANNVTGSVFVKAGSVNYAYVQLSNYSSSFATAVFNVSGTTNSTALVTHSNNDFSVVSTKSVYVGNGWHRLFLTINSTAQPIKNMSVGLHDTGSPTTWTAEGDPHFITLPISNASYAFFAFPQIEQGSGSSYIYNRDATSGTQSRSRAAETYILPTASSVTVNYQVQANGFVTSNTFTNGTSITLPDCWVDEPSYVSVIKQAGKIVSSVVASTVSYVRQADKIVSVVVASTITIVKGLTKTVSVLSASTATITKQAGKPISVVQSTVASFVRSAGKLVNAVSTSTTSLTKQAGKTASVLSTSVVSFVKSITKTASVIGTTTASVAATRAFLRTISAVVTTTSLFVKQAGKVVSATKASTTTFVKSAGKTVSATSTSTSAFTKQAGKIISAAKASTTSFVKSAGKIVSATKASTTTFARSVGKTVSVVGASATSFVKQMPRTISTTSSSAVSFVKQALKTVAVSRAITTTVEATKTAIQYAQEVAAVVASAVTKTLSTNKIVSATKASTTTLSRSAGKIVSALVSSTTSWAKHTSKIVSVLSTSVVSFVRQIAKGVAVTKSSTTSLTKQAGKQVSLVASAAAVTINKQVGKIVSVLSATTTTLVQGLAYLKAVSATVTSSVSLARSVGKILSVVEASAVTITRVYAWAKTITANPTSLVTTTKAISKTVSAVRSTIVTATKQTAKTIAAIKASVVSVVTSFAFLLTVSASLSTTASIVKSAGKRIEPTIASAVSMVRQPAKIISVVVPLVVSFAKAITKTVSIVSTISTIVNTTKAYLLTISADIASAVSRTASVGKQIVADAIVSASVARLVGKLVNTVTTATVEKLATVSKNISATVSKTVNIVTNFAFLITVVATNFTAVTFERAVNKLTSIDIVTQTAFAKRITKTISATVASAVDWFLSLAGQFFITLNAMVSTHTSTALSVDKIIDAVVTSVTSISRVITKILTQTVTTTVEQIRTIGKSVALLIRGGVSIFKQTGKVIATTKSVSVTLRKAVSLLVSISNATSTIITNGRLLTVAIVATVSSSVVETVKFLATSIRTTATGGRIVVYLHPLAQSFRRVIKRFSGKRPTE